jgi:hypothetical protein
MSTMNQIRSYDHQLYNITINKLGLSPFDDKRYILDDGINSLISQNVQIMVQNLGQYHDLYILTDVLSLADIFENFREICINYYGLDAAQFYTSPGVQILLFQAI